KEDLKTLEQHVDALQIHETDQISGSHHEINAETIDSRHDDSARQPIPSVAATVLHISSTLTSAITIIEAVNDSLEQQLKKAKAKGDCAAVATLKWELNMLHGVVACLVLAVGGGYYWGYFNVGDISTLPRLLKEVFF